MCGGAGDGARLEGVADALTILDAGEYVRRARRLRARWAGKPERLQRELGELSRQSSAARLPGNDPGPARVFSEAAAAAMEGPVLRYSARQGLMKLARRLGIERFEANLLIAAVQHRVGARWDQRNGERIGTMGWVMMGALVQAGILGIIAAMWWG